MIDFLNDKNLKSNSSEMEEMRQSQKQLEQVNRIVGLGYWSWDVRTDQVQISDNMMHIFSDDHAIDLSDYQELMRFIHPEDRVIVRQSIQAALTQDSKFSFNIRITRSDGSPRTLRCVGEVIHDDPDESAKVLGTVQDITDLMSLENKLLESEKRYRYLVQELPNTGVVLYDPELTVFLVEGDDFVKVYPSCGIPVAQLLVKILGVTEAEINLDLCKSVFAGETNSFEQISGEKCFSVSYVPLRNNDNETYAGMAVIQDITQRVRVAEKLTRMANQLRMLNRMGQLVVSNRNTETIFTEVLKSLRQLTDAENVFIFLENNGDLLIQAQNPAGPNNLVGKGMPISAGIAGEVWRTQTCTLLSGEECRQKRFQPLADQLSYPARSFMAVPITWQDQKFGVLEAVHSQEDKFIREDLNLSESVAAWAAIALNNALQHQRMERSLSESEITARLLEEILNAKLSVESVLQHIVEAGKEIVQSVDWAAIHLVDERKNQLRLEALAGVYIPAEQYTLGYGQGIAGRVLQFGQLINVADVGQDARVAGYPSENHASSLLVAPINNHEGTVIGTITLQSSKPNQFTSQDENLLLLLAQQSGLAIEKARLYETVENRRRLAQLQSEQLRKLTHQLVTSQEDERARIARELHDEAGQSLTALKIALEFLTNKLPPEMEEARETLQDAAGQAGKTLENLRAIAYNLRPPSLDRLGINQALASLCKQFEANTQIRTDYQGYEVPRLPESHEITLYRFVQEALTNIAKYADATEAQVRLSVKTGTVDIDVRDNGKGMPTSSLDDQDDHLKGMGLASMKERMNIINGHLEIQSAPGKGTHLHASVALRLRENSK